MNGCPRTSAGWNSVLHLKFSRMAMVSITVYSEKHLLRNLCGKAKIEYTLPVAFIQNLGQVNRNSRPDMRSSPERRS